MSAASSRSSRPVGGAGNPAPGFSIVKCSVGHVLVAFSERGICRVALGDQPDRLRRELLAHFSNAELREGDAVTAKWAAQVADFIESPLSDFDLPLDIQGTAFQRKVWAALRKIPVGTTASYAAIARRIGKPRAVRAVANACGANRLAVIIPCHRVIRSDGGLGGYGGGVERKRKLLEIERVRETLQRGAGP